MSVSSNKLTSNGAPLGAGLGEGRWGKAGRVVRLASAPKGKLSPWWDRAAPEDDYHRSKWDSAIPEDDCMLSRLSDDAPEAIDTIKRNPAALKLMVLKKFRYIELKVGVIPG